jgi:hypothetical protein
MSIMEWNEKEVGGHTSYWTATWFLSAFPRVPIESPIQHSTLLPRPFQLRSAPLAFSPAPVCEISDHIIGKLAYKENFSE